MKENTTNQFLIGSWVSFYPFNIDSYEYQLDQMADAGLNFNIFPAVFGGGMLDADTWENVEKQYAARDMYYCMNGGLRDDMLLEGVSYANGKEHCIGYHLIDEPGGGALPTVGRYVRAYREADNKRYPFVNLFPSYVGTAVMEGDYYQYCTRFVKEAGVENIEYLSHDYYPFHIGNTALSIFGDMEVIRRVAFENQRLRTHAFPQSTAWMGTRMPNIDEMRWNVYAYLTYGFKALSWFNLVCPGKSDSEGECFRESVIYRDGTIRDKKLFKEFGKLNREARTLGNTLMKLDTVHAYHTRDGIAGVESLPKDWMITPVDDVDFVISHMVTLKGDETYVMLFNNSWEHPTTASFRISEFSGIESMCYISPFNGVEYAANLHNGIITETFRPGEGKLYKLNGDLSYRVLPLDSDHSRAFIDLKSTESIAGADVFFPLHDQNFAVTVQISTNKKFPDGKTTEYSFANIPESGKLRFEPALGKYIRFSVGQDGNAPSYGWADIRICFVDEPTLTTNMENSISISQPDCVIIPLHVSPEDLFTLLPALLKGVDSNQNEFYLKPVWNLKEFDTSLSGSRLISGSVHLPNGDTATVHMEAVVTYEVDFSDLNDALEVVNNLNRNEYSAESWKAVQDYYDAAVAMKDGTYPQNAVTVAAWQLLDRVRELEPVQWTIPEREEADNSHRLHVKKGVLPAAIATVAGALAGALTGFFAKKRKDK
jgi:hypothetical protein